MNCEESSARFATAALMDAGDELELDVCCDSYPSENE